MENSQRDSLANIVNQIYNFEKDYDYESLANASDWIELLQEYFPERKEYLFIENIASRTSIELLSMNLGDMVYRSDSFSFDITRRLEDNIEELNTDDILEIYNHIFEKDLQPITINDDKNYGVNEDDRFESISISHIVKVLAITFERLLETQLKLLKLRFFYLPKDKVFYEKINVDANKETIDEIIANVTGNWKIMHLVVASATT